MSGTLPRAVNDPATITPVSVTRLVQTNTALEAAWQALFPAGVVSGGLVTWTTGFSVQVGVSVFLAEGVTLTLAAPQAYTAAEASNNVRLWGRIRRTAAAQASSDARTNPDTYDLVLDHTKGGTYLTPPVSSAGPWIPLADWLTNGAAVIGGAIDNGPAGKYLKGASPLWLGQQVLASTDVAAVGSGEQFSVAGRLQVRGRLIVRGLLRLR